MVIGSAFGPLPPPKAPPTSTVMTGEVWPAGYWHSAAPSIVLLFMLFDRVLKGALGRCAIKWALPSHASRSWKQMHPISVLQRTII